MFNGIGSAIGFMAGGGETSAWDPANKDANLTLSSSNFTAELSTGIFDSGGVRSLTSKSSGKLYAELTLVVWNAGQSRGGFGVGTSANATTDTYFWGTDSTSASYAELGGGSLLYYNSGTSDSATTLAQGQIIGLAVDVPNHLIYWSNNGTWQASGNPSAGTGGKNYITTNPIYLFAGLRHGTSGSGEKVTLNTGGSAFSYAIPTGFTAWG